MYSYRFWYSHYARNVEYIPQSFYVHNFFLQLADLVGLVRGKLKKIARMMLSALIVIEVQWTCYM